MQKYPVRATHRANLAVDRLEAAARSGFGDVTREGERVTARFGAISRLTVWMDGRELAVDLTMDPKVPEEVARETIRRYNLFLEDVTGMSAKERARKLRKSASG